MKKMLKKFVLFFTGIFLLAPIFCGCARTGVSHRITSYPNKLVYQVGDKPDFSGLRIETINNDGTHTWLRFSNENIDEVDTSTPGTKKVVVTKDNATISFNIYVANVVVNDSDNIREIFANLKDGDIVYLREGNYIPQNSADTRYKDIVVTKSVTIVGDGAGKTKFGGNFVIGAEYDGGVFTKVSTSNVKILDMGFEIESEVKKGVVKYTGPYGSTDKNGALRVFDVDNLLVSSCSFSGYGFGILANSLSGCVIQNCHFKNIINTGIKVTDDISNSTIAGNIFMDIANNVAVFENGFQSWIGAISLGFSSKGQKGVIIAKNAFNRIGAHTGDVIYFDEQSKSAAETSTNSVFKNYYVNNTSAIILTSSTTDDLEVSGIIVSNNNYSGSFESLYLGTRSVNSINQNGVIIAE